LSLLTLHYIVVMARVWRRREMIFLREELIAEGLQPLLFFQLEFGRQEKDAEYPSGAVSRTSTC